MSSHHQKGTKERIRDRALDLFSGKGYDHVTMRDIGNEVGISESSIYNHYESKEEILESIIHSLIERSENVSRSIPLEEFTMLVEPKTLVLKGITSMMQILKVPYIRKTLRLMVIEVYKNNTCQKFFKETYIAPSINYWTELFEKLMNGNHIRHCNPRQLAREFFYHCLFLMFESFLLNYDSKPHDVLVNELLQDVTRHVDFLFKMLQINDDDDGEQIENEVEESCGG